MTATAGFPRERLWLQFAVAIAGLVPVSAGGAGALLGTGFLVPAPTEVSLDSHFRYLSGLLLGIGLAFWWALPVIERRTALFRTLTAIVFLGGLARLLGIAVHGRPEAGMVFGLAMELIVTPALCLWQGRVARICGRN